MSSKITAIVTDDGFALDMVGMPHLRELRLVTENRRWFGGGEVWVFFEGDEDDSPSLVLDSANVVRVGYDSVSREAAREEMKENVAARKLGLH